MVHLTMTAVIVSAINLCNEYEDPLWPPSRLESEPELGSPAVGKPISHAQILELHAQLRKLRDQGIIDDQYGLDDLLRGSMVWVEPPKPKPEPTDEFKALMARLRAEQEAQSYSHMLSTSGAPSTNKALAFAQRFPHSPYANLFPDSQASLPPRLSSARQLPSRFDQSDSVVYDDASFATVNRQLALIGNVLISIIATAVAIWWATWHWGTAARLGISMGGSGLVGVAEVVVYLGYIQRLEKAKTKEKSKGEVKKVAKTWVIEGRRGKVEKRLAEATKAEASNEGDVVATGSWPQVPESMRKRNPVKSYK